MMIRSRRAPPRMVGAAVLNNERSQTTTAANSTRVSSSASVMVHGALTPLAGARSVPPLGSLNERSRGGRDFVVRAEIVE
jgi:hypothetical protein